MNNTAIAPKRLSPIHDSQLAAHYQSFFTGYAPFEHLLRLAYRWSGQEHFAEFLDGFFGSALIGHIGFNSKQSRFQHLNCYIYTPDPDKPLMGWEIDQIKANPNLQMKTDLLWPALTQSESIQLIAGGACTGKTTLLLWLMYQALSSGKEFFPVWLGDLTIAAQQMGSSGHPEALIRHAAGHYDFAESAEDMLLPFLFLIQLKAGEGLERQLNAIRLLRQWNQKQGNRHRLIISLNQLPHLLGSDYSYAYLQNEAGLQKVCLLGFESPLQYTFPKREASQRDGKLLWKITGIWMQDIASDMLAQRCTFHPLEKERHENESAFSITPFRPEKLPQELDILDDISCNLVAWLGTDKAFLRREVFSSNLEELALQRKWFAPDPNDTQKIIKQKWVKFESLVLQAPWLLVNKTEVGFASRYLQWFYQILAWKQIPPKTPAKTMRLPISSSRWSKLLDLLTRPIVSFIRSKPALADAPSTSETDIADEPSLEIFSFSRMLGVCLLPETDTYGLMKHFPQADYPLIIRYLTDLHFFDADDRFSKKLQETGLRAKQLLDWAYQIYTVPGYDQIAQQILFYLEDREDLDQNPIHIHQANTKDRFILSYRNNSMLYTLLGILSFNRFQKEITEPERAQNSENTITIGQTSNGSVTIGASHHQTSVLGGGAEKVQPLWRNSFISSHDLGWSTQESLLRAYQYFDQAIAKDCENPLTYYQRAKSRGEWLLQKFWQTEPILEGRLSSASEKQLKAIFDDDTLCLQHSDLANIFHKQHPPYQQKAEHLREEALIFFRKKEYTQALSLYMQACLLQPNAESFESIGVTLYELGRDKEALLFHHEAIRLRPDKAVNWHNAGLAMGRINSFEALPYMDIALSWEPDRVESLRERGRLFLRHSGQDNAALKDFSRLVEIEPLNPLNWHERAWLYAQSGDTLRAIADWDKAIELDDKVSIYWHERASMHAKLENYPKAIADWDKAIELDDKVSVYWHERASMHARLENYLKAIADWDKAIELDGIIPAYWRERGWSKAKLKHFADAISDYNQAIFMLGTKRHSDLSNTSVISGGSQNTDCQNIGWSTLGGESTAFTDAKVRYILAAKLHYERGLVYAQFDVTQAIADFLAAIELDYLSYEALIELGSCYIRIFNLEDAVTAYETATQLQPENPIGWAALADLSYQMNDLDKAVLAMQRATELDSKNAYYHKELGVALRQSGRLEEALTEFEQACQLNPDNGECWKYKGWTYYMLGEPALALADLEHAVSLCPDDDDAHYGKAQVHHNLQQFDQALHEIRIACELMPDKAEYKKFQKLIIICVFDPIQGHLHFTAK